MDTLEELLNEVPRGVIIILPNRDLSSSDYTITNDTDVNVSYENSLIEELEHDRYNRSVMRRDSLQTRLNSRQESSNESDDNHQDIQDYDIRSRRIIRRDTSVEIQSDSRVQRNNNENLSKLLHYLANIINKN